MAVAEAARNIVCSGGTPLGVTNCLNFGNPYQPHVYWQFKEAILGMKEACEKLNTPVTGGNVSFYNQSPDGPVFPSPVIGMVGLVEDADQQAMTLAFQEAGHSVWLIGTAKNDLAGSEYVYAYHKQTLTPAPAFDWSEELKLQELTLHLIRHKVITSAHDVADGGLLFTLLESAFPKNLGFQVRTDSDIRWDAFWFGESASRIVVSLPEEKEVEFQKIAQEKGVNHLKLGTVSDGKITVSGMDLGNISDWKSIWENRLSEILEG
jgi:phosphoribosylformylglycinamidine synthase